MVLLAMKVFVSIKSVSLAIIASTLDSLLDLLSGFILWYTSYKMRRPNPYHYPIGKNRMQPVVIHSMFLLYHVLYFSIVHVAHYLWDLELIIFNKIF